MVGAIRPSAAAFREKREAKPTTDERDDRGNFALSSEGASGLDVYSCVWNIYDDYRHSLYYLIYYSKDVRKLETRIMWLDILIAIGTSSTGISGWALWNKPEFAAFWAGFAGITATMAIIKPVLKWESDLSKSTRLVSEYNFIYSEYKALARKIAALQGISLEVIHRQEIIFNVMSRVEPVPKAMVKEDKEIRDEVNLRLPMETFWSPT